MATGWQIATHLPPLFYGDFLQYEEPGFSRCWLLGRLQPWLVASRGPSAEILSARGEVKMSAIVQHGAT